MKKKSVRYTLGTTLGLGLIAALMLNHFTTTAWAMERTIAALKKYKALHLTGHTASGSSAGPLEVWARANASGTCSEACLAKMGSITVWVEGNKTYAYEPGQNKVWVEPGITAGVNPWFGPKFLSTFARVRDYQAHEGTDAATGQKRVLATGSLPTALGPQSFLIEFGAETKLPVSMKGWRNLNRHGTPEFVFDKIVYFEDLPDSTFRFVPPPGVPLADKPLTIPEANVAALSDPKDGIPATGLTREEACRKLLEQMWDACIREDLPRIRRLCPLTAGWPEELFRTIAGQDEPVKVLSIGSIEQTGQSRLGPLALVPSRLQCKDGKTREVRMVVQFRETDQGLSCVVHGPHGNSIEVKE
ncbi:MAG: hypothetical protein HZA90_23350 [Verrucomicrobia bacterium]|nr:hypothetical protein [Verrucomicrobiota bacterium]